MTEMLDFVCLRAVLLPGGRRPVVAEALMCHAVLEVMLIFYEGEIFEKMDDAQQRKVKLDLGKFLNAACNVHLAHTHTHTPLPPADVPALRLDHSTGSWQNLAHSH